MLVSDIVAFSARRCPDRAAVVYQGRSLSYRELNSRINQLSNALLGIAATDDSVAILSQNCQEYIECLYAVPKAGMSLVLLNYRLAPKDMIKIIENAQPKVLVTESNHLEFVMSVREKIPVLKYVISIDGGPDVEDYESFLLKAGSGTPNVNVPDNSPAWLIYTSGTTGSPKGALLNHGNLISSALSSVIELAPALDDVVLFPFPLCHVVAQLVLVHHFRGLPMVIMRRFDPEDLLVHIEKYRVTRLCLAPTMINFLLDYPSIDKFDITSLRRIGYGTSPIPESILRKAIDRFGPIFIQILGMTELAGGFCVLSREAHQKGITEKPELLTSCGKPMILVDVRIVDDSMQVVVIGEVGEVVVRGGQVMAGYWNMPEATEEAFTAGWFHTGDLARTDHEGYIYVVDRKKDMIVTGGENVYLKEIEEIIYMHPAVSEVAVIGIPDEIWGENVYAVVRLKEDMQTTEQNIIDLCKEHLASYKKSLKG